MYTYTCIYCSVQCLCLEAGFATSCPGHPSMLGFFPASQGDAFHLQLRRVARSGVLWRMGKDGR